MLVELSYAKDAWFRRSEHVEQQSVPFLFHSARPVEARHAQPYQGDVFPSQRLLLEHVVPFLNSLEIVRPLAVLSLDLPKMEATVHLYPDFPLRHIHEFSIASASYIPTLPAQIVPKPRFHSGFLWRLHRQLNYFFELLWVLFSPPLEPLRSLKLYVSSGGCSFCRFRKNSLPFRSEVVFVQLLHPHVDIAPLYHLAFFASLLVRKQHRACSELFPAPRDVTATRTLPGHVPTFLALPVVIQEVLCSQ